MRVLFNSLQPLLRFGLGLFVLALLGALAQVVGQWIDISLGRRADARVHRCGHPDRPPRRVPGRVTQGSTAR